MNKEELLWDQIHRQQEMIDSLLGMCDNLNARIKKLEKSEKPKSAPRCHRCAARKFLSADNEWVCLPCNYH